MNYLQPEWPLEVFVLSFNILNHFLNNMLNKILGEMKIADVSLNIKGSRVFEGWFKFLVNWVKAWKDQTENDSQIQPIQFRH